MHANRNLQPQTHTHINGMHGNLITHTHKHTHISANTHAHSREHTIKTCMLTATNWHTPNCIRHGYIPITHKSRNAFRRKNHTHAHTNTLYIDHNLSFRSSVTFIHLFVGLFIYLWIHYSLDWLSFYLRAWFPRGARENIHLLMRAVINSEQARPSLSPSVRVSLSLCPSDGFSRSLSLPISPIFCRYLSHLCLSLLLCVFQSQSMSFSLSLSLTMSIVSGWIMKMLCLKIMCQLRIHTRVFLSFKKISHSHQSRRNS